MISFLPLYLEKYYVVITAITLFCIWESVRNNLITERPKLWLKFFRGIVFRLSGYHNGAKVDNFIIRDRKGTLIDPRRSYERVLKVIRWLKILTATLAIGFFITVC